LNATAVDGKSLRGCALTGRERQDVASAAPMDGFTAAGQGATPQAFKPSIAVAFNPADLG